MNNPRWPGLFETSDGEQGYCSRLQIVVNAADQFVGSLPTFQVILDSVIQDIAQVVFSERVPCRTRGSHLTSFGGGSRIPFRRSSSLWRLFGHSFKGLQNPFCRYCIFHPLCKLSHSGVPDGLCHHLPDISA